jgi:8-oxo-dGTP pyrophosphatase MutT (NUDIX family)
VRIDRPPPGEEIDFEGEASVPRQAATVILLRGGAETLEVLLVKRTPKARFMGGVWVFPGGAVDTTEGDGDTAHRIAAVRELEEEAAFSRWITPPQVKIRFDTHFFLAPLPEGQEPRVDGEECVDLAWFTPRAALDAAQREEIVLVFPTIKHLEQLAGFESADAVLDHARGRTVEPVVPHVVMDGEVARVVLPGDAPAGG